MRNQAERLAPCRRSIYWKVEEEKTGCKILVYSFRGLIRLNQTASLIWEHLDGRHSLEELLVTLRKSFPNAPAEQLKEDLENFLRSAETMGLICRQWRPLQPYQVLNEELVP